MLANYHTHTCRCHHAQGSEEDYVRSAIRYGLSALGFSDHGPFPDRDFGFRMDYGELDDYLQTIDRLSLRYGDQIRLHKGVEIEYMPQYLDYYHFLLEEKKLNYLLLGEHFFCNAEGIVCSIYDASSTEDFLTYARAISQALHTGLFPVVAHPDIFAMHPFRWDRNCDTAADLILQAAADCHAVLEFNANGVRQGERIFPEGLRFRYPIRQFWEKVSGTGIPVIVGSDAHDPFFVWDYPARRSAELLGEVGITPLEDLEYLFET